LIEIEVDLDESQQKLTNPFKSQNLGKSLKIGKITQKTKVNFINTLGKIIG